MNDIWRKLLGVAGVAILVMGLTGCLDNTKVTLDTNGDRVDAHDGDYFVADGAYWLVGTAYGCGFTLGGPSPYCGVRVYRSTDLATWTPAGSVRGTQAFDERAGDWQATCTDPMVGCFRPHVEQRLSDGKYVMWLNVPDGAGPTESGYRVLVSDAPGGPYELLPTRPILAVDPGGSGLQHGDMDITVAPDGRAFVVYTVIRESQSPSHSLVIEELDASLTSGTGIFRTVPAANVLVGNGPVEAPGLFLGPNGVWELIFSAPALPYGVAATGMVDASDPLGVWSNPRHLNDDSCGGQPAGARQLGRDYVYWTDRWVQTDPPGGVVGNQDGANTYLGPLTFNAIDPVTGRPAIDEHFCVPVWAPQPL